MLFKEYKINELIAAGIDGKQIAELLGIRDYTFLRQFKRINKISFREYKKRLIESLKNGTYEPT